jgi:toxin ParE1/3/4
VSKTPVIPRALTVRDVEGRDRQLRGGAGAEVGLSFVDALEAAYQFISPCPAAGSPRHAHELAILDLRCHALKRYPHLVSR